MLTEALVARVKMAGVGRTADKAGIDRFWVSRLLQYNSAIQSRDPRIVKLGRLVGLKPDEIFEPSGKEMTG